MNPTSSSGSSRVPPASAAGTRPNTRSGARGRGLLSKTIKLKHMCPVNNYCETHEDCGNTEFCRCLFLENRCINKDDVMDFRG